MKTEPAAQGTRPPATLAGLVARPCDPLFLAVRLDGEPLRGLTGRVDWRLGARLSDLVREGTIPWRDPLLLPPSPLLPVGRIVLWRIGAATPEGFARVVDLLRSGEAGLCPEDFEVRPSLVRKAFGNTNAVLYAPPASRTARVER